MGLTWPGKQRLAAQTSAVPAGKGWKTRKPAFWEMSFPAKGPGRARVQPKHPGTRKSKGPWAGAGEGGGGVGGEIRAHEGLELQLRFWM